MASDITQTHSRKHRRRGVPIAGFTVGTETPLPHPPSAQKERAVAGARIFVTYYYYYYYYYYIIVSSADSTFFLTYSYPGHVHFT